MATKHVNRVKMTAWTPTMRMEFDGSRASAITMLFHTLNTQDARSRVLAELHDIDAKMTTQAQQEAQTDASNGG